MRAKRKSVVASSRKKAFLSFQDLFQNNLRSGWKFIRGSWVAASSVATSTTGGFGKAVAAAKEKGIATASKINYGNALSEALAQRVEMHKQKMFETGSIFNLHDSISEKINLAVISAHKDANFTEIKSVLQTILKVGFGIQIQTKTAINSIFKDGHCANIIFNGNIIGIIGEINSSIIDNYKIRVPVVGFEISLSDYILKLL